MPPNVFAIMSRQAEPNTSPGSGDMEKNHIHEDQGTEQEPIIVEFHKDDPENPMNWGQIRKWFVACIATLSVFVVTFTSSAYSESSVEILQEFGASTEVFVVGVSVYVLGFAIGPVIWAPLSEFYGRRMLWIISHIAMVAFIGGSAGSQNIATLMVLRFLTGTFGGSPIVNSGGVLADIFPPAQRGLALTLYALAPFFGPVLGPIVGGFVSENVGWRWVQGVCCIAIGIVGILGIIFIPETYGPTILLWRASRLSKTDGKTYISVLEKNQGKKKPSEVFKKALVRPWVLLFLEPIVLVASLYIAVIYAIIYMFLPGMTIVFNVGRGWSEGVGGLAFLGMAVGIVIGGAYAIYDNKRYMKLFMAKTATAESRLPPAMLGAVALPIGIFAFAWTNFPSIHWAVCIVLSAPFGFGCILVVLPVVNYLIDSYTIYAASVLAASAILRSVLAAAFPLFTAQMYANLGIHWASSVPGFLTLACMPFPFIMYRYGKALRMKCKYSFEAAEIMKQMQKQQEAATNPNDEGAGAK
ncbi:major facilitator superfamily domain-containing protein [Chaetomium tenue]|uniref:Major facilitator superfamily domain-containing protein n=1 Tax=Chaetomium tenue TaxID=1854479 RepID=A0ACB7NZV0_9PEZI|nr:major facilitator superfamily domain-containing protein [Chaetomium globosum]